MMISKYCPACYNCVVECRVAILWWILADFGCEVGLARAAPPAFSHARGWWTSQTGEGHNATLATPGAHTNTSKQKILMQYLLSIVTLPVILQI